MWLYGTVSCCGYVSIYGDDYNLQIKLVLTVVSLLLVCSENAFAALLTMLIFLLKHCHFFITLDVFCGMFSTD